VYSRACNGKAYSLWIDQAQGADPAVSPSEQLQQEGREGCRRSPIQSDRQEAYDKLGDFRQQGEGAYNAASRSARPNNVIRRKRQQHRPGCAAMGK